MPPDILKPQKEEVSSGRIDVSDRSLVLMKGADAEDLLQRISTNDVSPLKNGELVQTVFTSEKGRIVEVVAAVRSGEGILLAGQSNQSIHLLQWIEKFIIMDDVTVESVSGNYHHELLFGQSVEGPVTAGKIEFKEVFGKNVLTHVLTPRPDSAGFPEVDPPRSYEDFRIERGIPAWPGELSGEYNPLEAGLGALVSWTKGCYVGQEVIARLDTYKKVQKHLTILECAKRPDRLPARIVHKENDAGLLTSVTGGKRKDRFIGLGFLRSVLEKEADLELDIGSERIPIAIRGK